MKHQNSTMVLIVVLCLICPTCILAIPFDLDQGFRGVPDLEQPWSAELTGAAKAGRNELAIDEANPWVNRLMEDAGQQKEQELTEPNLALQQGWRTTTSHRFPDVTIRP